MSDVLWLRWFNYRQFDQRQVSDNNFLQSVDDYATLEKLLPESKEKRPAEVQLELPFPDLTPLRAYEDVL